MQEQLEKAYEREAKLRKTAIDQLKKRAVGSAVARLRDYFRTADRQIVTAAAPKND